MKVKNCIVLSCLLWTASSAFAGSHGTADERVIYGTDERVDAEVHPNLTLRNLSKSVAGRIRKTSVTYSESAMLLPTDTLKDAMNVCENERFALQKAASECTGFLVGKDILVTAGHCVESQADCEQNTWAFGYVDGVSEINKSEVYDCKEIIAQELSDSNDFAVIRLDREVSGREVLKFRKEGSVLSTDKIAVIGHPSGLPLKIDDSGLVRDPSDALNYFVAELDTYGGNSGSPVFNLSSGEVEGILVRGERDYVWNGAQSCAVSNVCATGTCRGEDVQKITKVLGLPLQP